MEHEFEFFCFGSVFSCAMLWKKKLNIFQLYESSLLFNETYFRSVRILRLCQSLQALSTAPSLF